MRSNYDLNTEIKNSIEFSEANAYFYLGLYDERHQKKLIENNQKPQKRLWLILVLFQKIWYNLVYSFHNKTLFSLYWYIDISFHQLTFEVDAMPKLCRNSGRVNSRLETNDLSKTAVYQKEEHKFEVIIFPQTLLTLTH